MQLLIIVLLGICKLLFCVGIPTRLIPSQSLIQITNLTLNSCNETTSFQRFVITNESIYVGATNSILQFTTELALQHQYNTGPGNDSETCGSDLLCSLDPADICVVSDLRCNDNYNKLLIPYRNRILACGTLYETCDLLNLTDISMRFGSKEELKCLDFEKSAPAKINQISTRNISLPVIGAIFVNSSHDDSDLLYLGKFHENLDVLIAPSITNNYFTLIEDTDIFQLPVYHYIWTTEQYGYILWSNNSALKLSRFCNRAVSQLKRAEIGIENLLNHGIPSYTEITLKCTLSGTNLTNLISAKLLFDKLFLLYQHNNNIVICSANMTTLNESINFVRRECFLNASGNSSNIAKIHSIDDSIATCSSLGYSEDWVTCSFPYELSRFASYIEGLQPFILQNNLEFSNVGGEIATGFTVGSENGFFTAFVGTESGNILKVNFNMSATLSEIITTSTGIALLDSMDIDDSGENLFAISLSALYKIQVSNCSQYQTCFECLKAQDIYCGWCIYQGSCQKKSSCYNSNRGWLRPNTLTSLCPKIVGINPNLISTESTTIINLNLSGTELNTTLSYRCQFGVGAISNDFSPTELLFNPGSARNATCRFDATDSNFIPAVEVDQIITLHVVYNGNSVTSVTFRLYSCSQVQVLNPNEVCTSCVSYNGNCSWCLDAATCRFNSPCNNEKMITQKSECPTVLNTTKFSDQIPVGLDYNFTIKTGNIFRPFTNYLCRFNFCNKTVSVPSLSINATNANCSISANQLTCDRNTSSIEVLLISKPNYIIDIQSLKSVTATIFNCSVQRTSCGSCIAFRSDYVQCGWCSSTSTCVVQSQCPGNALFFTSISNCPDAEIFEVNPLSAPVEGGTEVNITGVNLGSSVNEIISVTLGSINCTVISGQYIPSKQIVCKAASSQIETEGVVVVGTNYGADIRSNISFAFKNVKASFFSPSVTLNQSLLTINGMNLDVGNKAFLSVNASSNDSRICERRSSDLLTCRIGNLSVGTFNPTVIINDYRYTFPNNLTIVAAPTTKTKITKIEAFREGGRNVSIDLTSVIGLQKVELQIEPGNVVTNCTINQTQNSQNVFCEVPPEQDLPSNSLRKRRETASRKANLLLNGVHSVPLGSVVYSVDPTLTGDSILPCGTNNSVQILGNNFRLPDGSTRNSEYSVVLIPQSNKGTIPCNITVVADKEIICSVSSSKLKQYEKEKFTIYVNIGMLELKIEKACPSGPIVYIVVACCLILILLVFITWLIWWQRKKKRQQEEERKLILTKLDDLENKTRENARNAYYELQVGYMENLAGNLTHRIIYHPPEQYFTQTLFNLSQGHPILDKSKLKNESPVRLEAIHKWTSLLKNKDFLLTFVRTLEEQKRFTVQEKGNVASLLTVCLFSDMPYFTSVMFDLLTDLIQKHVQRNPKLLLRRSESVVEKMVSHWLSITLYDECIMEKSGEPIFLLTKAIHFLVCSGPSDVIMHKSLNSLNESTLLGSEISHVTKKLLASIQETDSDEISSPVEVGVVDVDTITQVKEKIIEAVYKDRPFSECPKPDDLEFELLSGETAKEGIFLSDIDSTSVSEGSYTKINTLKHYNIPEKARVILRPAGSIRLASPTPRSPLLSERERERGLSLYHLIHPKDEEAAGYGGIENGGGKKTDAVLEGLINRPLQEIFLTRMVRSKTTLQEYVDNVFKSILCPQPIPYAVRYFFHFLDGEAVKHRINDSEVIHIWKTNSLLLRYWVNVLKNPEFIFDINKTVIVDSCLNVITQAFMDACATTNRKLGHDSPSNKLLYAKESQQYKELVKEFFVKVANTPWIDEKEMNKVLIKTSQQHASKFNEDVASQQLYQYLFKYKDQILEAVRNDEHEDIATQIESVMKKMYEKDESMTTVV